MITLTIDIYHNWALVKTVANCPVKFGKHV
jgi:hypothetical protein